MQTNVELKTQWKGLSQSGFMDVELAALQLRPPVAVRCRPRSHALKVARKQEFFLKYVVWNMPLLIPFSNLLGCLKYIYSVISQCLFLFLCHFQV